MILCLIFIAYVISSSLGMILIKVGGKNFYLGFLNSQFSLTVPIEFICGISLYIISFLLWIYILQKFSLTYISPVAYGISFILISTLSYFILNEAFTRNHLIGAFFIIIGVIISSIK